MVGLDSQYTSIPWKIESFNKYIEEDYQTWMWIIIYSIFVKWNTILYTITVLLLADVWPNLMWSQIQSNKSRNRITPTAEQIRFLPQVFPSTQPPQPSHGADWNTQDTGKLGNFSIFIGNLKSNLTSFKSLKSFGSFIISDETASVLTVSIEFRYGAWGHLNKASRRS